MKTIVTAFILASASLTAAALADSSSAPSSARTTLPSSDVVAVQEPTVTRIIQTEFTLREQHQATHDSSGMTRPQDSAAISFKPVRNAETGVVFSMTPSPFSYNAPHNPPTWYASISIPFGFGRNHHS